MATATTKTKPKFKQKVNLFAWEGVNNRGAKVKGELHAANQALIKAELRRQGIVATKIRKKAVSLFGSSKKRIKQVDIAVMSRQLATMMAAGIPLVQSFDILSRGQANPTMQTLLQTIKHDLEEGGTLYGALKKHPKYFNDLFCNLVNAGEQSGSLETMLGRIAAYKEKTEMLKSKIKKALFYPAAILAVAFLVTTILLVFVVPQFETVFKGFGADLPVMTRAVIGLSEFVQDYWWVFLLGIAGGIWAFVLAMKRSKAFAFAVDKLLLKVPVIGKIVRKSAIARFARTLATSFAAGLPLVDALTSVAGATGSKVYEQATLRIREDVATGQQIQTSMQLTKLFPNMVVQMIAIGEEAGSLEMMLVKIADFYEADVNDAVDNISSLLEPVIMVILGVLIGGLIIAMYMPIFKLGSVV